MCACPRSAGFPWTSTKAIAAALQGNPRYRLLAELPFKNSSGTGRYRIWIKTAP